MSDKRPYIEITNESAKGLNECGFYARLAWLKKSIESLANYKGRMKEVRQIEICTKYGSDILCAIDKLTSHHTAEIAKRDRAIEVLIAGIRSMDADQFYGEQSIREAQAILSDITRGSGDLFKDIGVDSPKHVNKSAES